MECEEFILPDWSPPNDPARVLAAEGRRNPSVKKNSSIIMPVKVSQMKFFSSLDQNTQVC